MALINCTECGKSFSDKAEFCPNCGCPTSYSVNQEDADVTDSTQEKCVDYDYSNIDVDKKGSTYHKEYNGDANDSIDKNSSTKFIIAAIVIGILMFAVISYDSSRKQHAINVVKNSNVESSYNVTDVIIKGWIANDKKIYKIYGWRATKIEDNTYFVSFEFDYDNDMNNGWKMYCYEVDIGSNIVRKITGNPTLEQKYKKLNIIR